VTTDKPEVFLSGMTQTTMLYSTGLLLRMSLAVPLLFSPTFSIASDELTAVGQSTSFLFL